jgi:nitrite reductase/ring-hydroxylating ferredoxin subunit
LSPNAARPAPGTRLCAVADLAATGAKGFLFRDGERLFLGFVVYRDGVARGFVDRCPHAGMPLAPMPDRYLTREGDLILCGAHGALFRPADGVCVAGPCAGKALEPWPVTIRDGAVLAG